MKALIIMICIMFVPRIVQAQETVTIDATQYADLIAAIENVSDQMAVFGSFEVFIYIILGVVAALAFILGIHVLNS